MLDLEPIKARLAASIKSRPLYSAGDAIADAIFNDRCRGDIEKLIAEVEKQRAAWRQMLEAYRPGGGPKDIVLALAAAEEVFDA
jgi:hypothetical protein